ncbi:hypothetical protein L226DRAFT_563584 [Lentinus tigrinus ALCF2SS1-7]|uniref:Uncharacterized protein n=1 Tax=Lentinus tigrinus ALCF2SS1-6 TaxID=1328759 RepID=A0A5C2S979_9APHY|nr:hypothetical protein L227DRAFT_529642 [Lentinus tigrinus ALCF2SS1-6]RPD68983.1 hypothetical protein L226DRAFT_563584 [Lentinus tigrinus ALCF2SS1-7]
MPRPLIPQPGYYAVIRIDPEAMVADLGLDDPETIQESRDMPRKKYLVYLEWPDELPMPDMRWCRYGVSPIGTMLRSVDETRGITPDMVIPIAPNKRCTGEHSPVHPTPAFPFSNCYHWALNHRGVRIRVHEDGVEHEGAISLSPEESYALKEGFFPDCQRARKAQREKYGESPDAARASSIGAYDVHNPELPVMDPAIQGVTGHIDVLTDTYYRLVTQRGLRRSGPPSESDMSDSAEDVTGSHDGQRQMTVTPKSSREGLGFDLFGWDPDLNTAKIPLVDVWLDIDKHLTEDDIPSPDELDKEFEQVNALITRGLARFASAQKTPEQIKDEYPVKDTELLVEPGELPDIDPWVEVITALWGDLQQSVISSFSCNPPFPALHIPGSDADGALPSPLYPLPGDERFSVPDAGAGTLIGTNMPLPASTDGNLTHSPECVSEGLVPPHVTSSMYSLGNPRVVSPSSTPSCNNANLLEPPPPCRRSRALTMYFRMRTKVLQFWRIGCRTGDVH